MARTRSAESIERRRAAHRAWRTTPEGRAYYAADREKHRDRERARTRRWKAANPDKVREQHRRRRASQVVDTTPLPALYPELNHGSGIAFWEDELRMDLAQERALAECEGRDPIVAIADYRRRELAWRQFAAPVLEELAA
jgi:hypothetical protein